jgi:hypothetical protein
MQNSAHFDYQPKAGVQLRLDGPIFMRLENWRRAQPKIPARSDAIRELLGKALALDPDQSARDRQS